MKRKAHLIWIAAIVLVLLLGFILIRTVANDELGEKVNYAAATFTDGVPATDGSRIPGIADALYQRLEAADRLQTIAAKVDDVYDYYKDLRNAQNTLLNLLKNNGSFEEMQAADQAMTEAYNQCYAAMAPYVSGKSAAVREESAAAMQAGAVAVVEAAETYNDYILYFRESVMKKFPNGILKFFLKNKEPQLWP